MLGVVFRILYSNLQFINISFIQIRFIIGVQVEEYCKESNFLAYSLTL